MVWPNFGKGDIDPEAAANKDERAGNDNEVLDGKVIKKYEAGDWRPINFEILRVGEIVEILFQKKDGSKIKIVGTVINKSFNESPRSVEVKRYSDGTVENVYENEVITLFAQVKETRFD